MQMILSWIEGVMSKARDTYGVNPLVFLTLMIGCSPFFYYSLFRLLRAAAKRLNRELGLWSAVFLAATSTPYLYVMIFGRNLPVWVYGLIVLLVGQGALTLTRKIKGQRRTDTDDETQE